MGKEQGELFLGNGKLTPSQEWELLARLFDEHNQEHGSVVRNAYYDPPVREMLGDLAGLTVLDAGSGNGYFTQQIAQDAERVIGLDASPTLVALATARNKHANTAYQVADLLEPLPLTDESIDVAISSLVFHYFPSLEKPSAELGRVLKPGGRVVMSVEHPALNDFYYTHGIKEGDYEVVPPGYEGPTKRRKLDRAAIVTIYHRPLARYRSAFERNGFNLTALDEPIITQEVADVHPTWQKIVGLQRIAVMKFTKR